MTQEEQHIRELAYDIWQSEGCPEGQDARHWEMARKLVEAQGGAGTPTVKPSGRTRKTTPKPVDATPGKTAKKSAASAQGVKPAKATPAKGNAQPGPDAATDAQAGNPGSIKKARTPRSTSKRGN